MRSKVCSVLLIMFWGVGCNVQNYNNEEVLNTQAGIDSLNTIILDESTGINNNLTQTDSLFKLSVSLGYEKGMAEAAANYIRLLTNSYQYEKALDFVSDNLARFEEVTDHVSQAIIYEEAGKMYFDLDNFDQAFDFLSRALNHYQITGSQKKESYIYSRFGLLFQHVDDQKAKEYFQKALDISYELDDSTGIARDLHNTGLIYGNRLQFDSALVYYERALVINKKTKNWNYYVRNLTNMADIEKRKENYSQSENLYKEIIHVIDSMDDKHMYAVFLLHLGDLYLNTKDYQKARPYFTQADSIGKVYSWFEIRKYGNMGLYNCYKNLNQNKLAIGYLEKQHAFNDSLQAKQNHQELTHLELKFKNDQLIREKVWEQQKQKFVLYFSLGLSLLIIILLIQLFRKQKLKIAKNKLEQKVLQNELEGKERELTSHVLNMIRLNEKKLGMINYLKSQKPRLKKENQDVIDTVVRDLEYDQDAQVWDEFEMRFNKVNSDFYQKLSSRFPDLTNNEKRLSAFLMMNMTTKEINSITGQSPEAISKARTRLRKKLGISNHSDPISNFLATI